MKKIPNYRLGNGDVKLDTIEVHSLSHPVGVEIRNVGENPVDVMIVDPDQVFLILTKGKNRLGLDNWIPLWIPIFPLSSLQKGELLNTEVEIDSPI
ncbi:MAG: hypothetical protein Ct9H90mP14_2100 [Methanobacteriota archaeon]|nr:MAG: hypothetical protein Ct9H90mP14_2100 [Euryarchaeota archaeon]